MTKIIEFPSKVQKVKSKVSNMPNLFTVLLELYKKKQDEVKERKIKFLANEAYKFYYALLETPRVADIDLPDFIYEEERKKLAKEYASKAMLDVILEDRVDVCYRKRIKEIKQRKIRK